MSNRKWGPRSKRVYKTLHIELQRLVDWYLQEVGDISLVCGHRTESEQNELYPTYTKVKWPDSKHNRYPAIAVDLQPYPYPKSDSELREQLNYIAGRLIQKAADDCLELRWGGDWNRNNDITDNKFDDLFHFELVDYT